MTILAVMVLAKMMRVLMKKNNLSLIILMAMMMLTNAYALNNNFLPRYASIKSNEVNSRTGPNLKYPISWVYVKKGEPVEIVAEFEQWNKIRDYKNDEGWVHKTMLSGKRYVVIKAEKNENVYDEPDSKNKIFIVEPNLRAFLIKCKEKHCEIKVENYSGWIERSKLWGIYEKEEYN